MDNLLIGEVVKPQGIKGELKVKLYDDSKDLTNIKKLILNKETMNVDSLSVRQGFMYVKLEGFCAIQEVERFRFANVYLLGEDAKELLSDGEFYVDKLVGYKVQTSSGEEVGVFADVQNYGSKDIAFLEDDGKQILLPIVDNLIEKVDEDNQTIILNAKIFNEVACYEDWYFNTIPRDV